MLIITIEVNTPAAYSMAVKEDLAMYLERWGDARGLDNAYRYLRFVSPAFIKVPRRRGNVSNR